MRVKLDMNSIVYHNLVDITKEGLTLESNKEQVYISFDCCVKNYSLEKGQKTSNCVATRDVTKLTFTFYTQPKINVVFKRNFLKDLIVKKSAVSKFLDLQKAILEVGYTSYDLS